MLDVDVEKERISLGIKQLTDDPFASATAEVKKGHNYHRRRERRFFDSGVELDGERRRGRLHS